MGDDTQTTGPNASLGSAATGFLGTVWGKVVAILAAISLIMGIALEVQRFVLGGLQIVQMNANPNLTQADLDRVKNQKRQAGLAMWSRIPEAHMQDARTGCAKFGISTDTDNGRAACMNAVQKLKSAGKLEDEDEELNAEVSQKMCAELNANKPANVPRCVANRAAAFKEARASIIREAVEELQ